MKEEQREIEKERNKDRKKGKKEVRDKERERKHGKKKKSSVKFICRLYKPPISKVRPPATFMVIRCPLQPGVTEFR
jgi:hypothetical protein